MKYLRRTGGFTLVELIVAIAVGSMVTIAALSLLLLGLRLDSHSRHTIVQQNTTRVITTMLENIASEGDVKKVICGPDRWYICSTDNKTSPPSEQDWIGSIVTTTEVNGVLVAYEADTGTLYTGGELKTTDTWEFISGVVVLESTKYTYQDGTPILENIHASDANLSEDNLLTVSVETKDGTYRTSTYCRLAPVKENSDAIVDAIEKDEAKDESVEEIVKDQIDDGTEIARKEFLKVAASQINSQGIIKEKIGEGNKPEEYREAGRYYARWYNPTWPEDTAWCACFVIWATDNTRWITQTDEPELLATPLEWKGDTYHLAHVSGLIAYLDGAYRKAYEDRIIGQENAAGESDSAESTVSDVLPGWYPCEITNDGWFPKNYELTPGDLIFFDYDGLDPDHVGIVLTVVDDYIYTIEGNTADMVAVRKYPVNDPRIMGYGVLDWKTNDQMPQKAN